MPLKSESRSNTVMQLAEITTERRTAMNHRVSSEKKGQNAEYLMSEEKRIKPAVEVTINVYNK